MSRTEYKRRVRRKDSYHLVASRNRLPADPEDQEEDMLFRYLLSTVPRTKQEVKIHQAKRLLLQELARSGGDVTLSSVVKALEDLIQLADPIDVRKPSSSSAVNAHSNATKQPSVEGMWIEISKPKFHGCLGMNAKGDFEYSLGRMSFDMFSPTSLLCSIQGSFNPVHEVCVQDIARSPQSHHVPEKLLAQLQNNDLEGTVLRSYE